MMHTLAFQIPSMMEWVVIAGIGLLLFGKRLPEVGKSVAGAIVNFKKGMREAQEEISRVDQPTSNTMLPPPSEAPTAALPDDAKFDPYTGKPIEKPKFDPYTGKPVVSDSVISHSEPHETVPPGDH